MELLPAKILMFLSQAQKTPDLFVAPGIAGFSALVLRGHIQSESADSSHTIFDMADNVR